MRKRWARAARVGQKKKVGGVPPEALEPWIHTLLDGQAALALESVVIKDMCTDGREELVFRKLNQRFPDKAAADRMGEAMEETFWTEITNETTEAFTERSRLVFTRRQTEVGNLPSQARGNMIDDWRAWVEQRSCLRHAETESSKRYARRPERRFLVVRWSHGAFGVDELEDRVENDPHDLVDFGGDAEFASATEAIVGALEPIERGKRCGGSS